MSEAIIDMLQKLLNAQKGAAAIGNEAEAAAFGQKVQELLDKYNLSEADLEARSSGDQSDLPDMGVVKVGGKDDGDWKTFLLCEIARLNTCKAFVGNVGDLYIGGTAVDIVITRELFNYFGQLISDLAQEAGYQYLRRLGYIEFDEKVFTQFYDSYALGAAMVLTRRLEETKKADFEKVPSESTALLVINKKEQALSTLLEDFSVGQVIRENEALNMDAYASGARAGHDLALTTKTFDSGK